MPSSKPYQRSLKNMCPLISPASSAPVSFILALISECPVFHSTGLPPWLRDPGEQVAGGFHVEDDLRPGLRLQHIRGEQHQLAVGVDDLAGLGYHTEPVAVAVEREAELVVAGGQRSDQVLQVLRLRRIGMMVGKVAVDLAEDLAHAAAEAPV